MQVHQVKEKVKGTQAAPTGDLHYALSTYSQGSLKDAY